MPSIALELRKCSNVRLASIACLSLSLFLLGLYFSPFLRASTEQGLITSVTSASSSPYPPLAYPVPDGVDAALLQRACSVCNPISHVCHRRLSWEELGAILAAGRASGGTKDWIQYISRVADVQDFYTKSRARMREEYRSVSDAVRRHKFHAPCYALEDSRLACEFTDDTLSAEDQAAIDNQEALPSSVCVPNDFAYALETHIRHMVIWTRVPLFGDTKRIKGLIERYYPATKYDTNYLVNPPALQTIRDIFHIHVFVTEKNQAHQQQLAVPTTIIGSNTVRKAIDDNDNPRLFKDRQPSQLTSIRLSKMVSSTAPDFVGLMFSPLGVEATAAAAEATDAGEGSKTVTTAAMKPFFVSNERSLPHSHSFAVPEGFVSGAKVRLIDIKPLDSKTFYSFSLQSQQQQSEKWISLGEIASFELDAAQMASLTGIYIRLEHGGRKATYVFNVKDAKSKAKLQ